MASRSSGGRVVMGPFRGDELALKRLVRRWWAGGTHGYRSVLSKSSIRVYGHFAVSARCPFFLLSVADGFDQNFIPADPKKWLYSWGELQSVSRSTSAFRPGINDSFFPCELLLIHSSNWMMSFQGYGSVLMLWLSSSWLERSAKFRINFTDLDVCFVFHSKSIIYLYKFRSEVNYFPTVIIRQIDDIHTSKYEHTFKKKSCKQELKQRKVISLLFSSDFTEKVILSHVHRHSAETCLFLDKPITDDGGLLVESCSSSSSG